MARRSQVFIGRLSRETRTNELEHIFDRYGKLIRCDIKYGSYGLAYAFVDFEDVRDAEDAIKYEDGRELHGHRLVVEWAKGPNYSGRDPQRSGCDYCGRVGHFYRDCPRRRDRERSRSRSPRKNKSRSRSRSKDLRKRKSRSPSPKRVKNGRQTRSSSGSASPVQKRRDKSLSASRSP